MLHTRLQPRHASPLRRVIAEIDDPFARLADAYDGITTADRNTPSPWLPYLIWQYGLGELAPYLPDLNDLIEEGLQWQRVRGTPAAITRGLGWLSYTGTLEEAPTRRRLWNKCQIQLGRVRDADMPDLARIDGIVSLSPPLRSRFTRGFRGYDVRAAETSWKRFSGSIVGDDSGVYLPNVGAKWSFGRKHSGAIGLAQTELTALGTWIPFLPPTDLWADVGVLWSDLPIEWALPFQVARRKAIAEALLTRTAYVRFATSGGAVIGYRRAIMRPVRPDVSGEYTVNGNGWAVSPGEPLAILARCRTGFGDGAGLTAATMTVVFDPVLAPGVKPGRLWLTPSQASGGIAVDPVSVSIPFGLTVRDECSIVMILGDEVAAYEYARGLVSLPNTYATLQGQTAPGVYTPLQVRAV